MRRLLSSAMCATAILMGGASVTALAPQAHAQIRIGIGFNMFHARLQNAGRWMRHPIWGEVWRPRAALVGRHFQPYTNGYWEYTDEYGWYWVSDDPFDDVVYHYGRWVFDPDDGWLWIPGYTWAPAWVVWRGGDDYTGWMPMPPDETFVSGTGLSLGFNLGSLSFNLYRNWYGNRVDPGNFWVFVDNRHLAQRDYRRFRVPRDRVRIVIDRTRDVTKLQVVNNHIVNRSVDVKVIERASGRRIAPVAARTVIKPNSIVTTVDESKQIRQRERSEHPIDVNAFRRGAKGGQQAAPNGGAAGGAGGNGTPGNGPGNATGATGAGNPGAGNNAGGAGSGGKPSDQTQTTGEKRHHSEKETSPPKTNGPAGATETGAGQSDENTTSAPGATPKKKRGGDSAGASNSSETGSSAASGGGMSGPSGGASNGDESSSGRRHRKSGTDTGEAGNATGGGSGSMSGSSGGSTSGPSSSGTPDATSGGRRNRSVNPSGSGSSAAGGSMSGPSGTSSDEAKPKKKKQKDTSGDSSTPPQQ